MQPTAPGQSSRPNDDQILKWMLTQAHDAFLQLVAPGLVWVGDRSPVLPSQPREADLVWEVERPSGGRGLLHVELQVKPNTDIDERVAEYAIRLWMRDHLPIRSIVTFLRQAASTPQSPFVIPWEENDDSMTAQYRGG